MCLTSSDSAPTGSSSCYGVVLSRGIIYKDTSSNNASALGLPSKFLVCTSFLSFVHSFTFPTVTVRGEVRVNESKSRPWHASGVECGGRVRGPGSISRTRRAGRTYYSGRRAVNCTCLAGAAGVGLCVLPCGRLAGPAWHACCTAPPGTAPHPRSSRAAAPSTLTYVWTRAAGGVQARVQGRAQAQPRLSVH